MDRKASMLAELKAAIEEWLAGKKTRSLSMLAHRTNKAYSTIRYIAQGERLPSESTIFSITGVIMTTGSRIEFFKKYFPEMGELMEAAYAKDVRQEPNHESLSKFIRLEPHNRIFNMAATHAGTTKNRVRALLGELGVAALNEMIEEQVLIEKDDGRVIYEGQSWTFENYEDALAQIRASTHHFDLGLIGTDANAVGMTTGSVSPEALSKIKKLVGQFFKDMMKLKEDPNYYGEIPFFCNTVYSI